MQPFFSIILPTYNRASFIPKAIQSVIDQEYGNWELLIIDDGSTDDTDQVMAAFTDDRIKYHWQENVERSAARNNGIRLAKGQYICFLDSDDYILPKHLRKLADAIEAATQPKALFFVQTIPEIEGELGKKICAPDTKVELTAEWLLGHSIGVPRWCGHREIFEDFQFDRKLRIGEDKELLMRIIQRYPLIPVLAWTAVFTEHEERTVHADPIDNALSHLKVIQQLCKSHISINSQAKRQALANAWYNVGQSYALQGDTRKAIIAFCKSSWYQPRYKVKRKIALLAGRN